MKNVQSVKVGSESIVAAVLRCFSYGPQTPADMTFSDESISNSGCSEVHVGLVCDQLVLAGCASQLPDQRYIITSQGETMLEQLLEEHHKK
ncbi:hypothetical protein [Photobacterium leiognathi]|uniref:hypothetical protein n=1 Tax=Photobacterium leiognathi TaxID=553611 RepID=UPI0002088072|nr:hypothetical protein [Photobacterium leiognathi]PSW48351.1 hypothetical protein CTM83_20170 [Photobacterium leiognathi subsp. mandapamensis]GAA03213.1 hypothetical protein PMSV_4138 [Photobacterium leiognathi subsp. mandapamensis svers.1.1.]